MADLITGLAHINLNVPDEAALKACPEFWSAVMGMREIPVPAQQKDTLKW